MATIAPTVSDVDPQDGASKVITWTPLTTTNADGTPVQGIALSDRTVQVFGTFGAGGSITMQGSMDGTNWIALTKPGGTPATLTAAGICAIVELTKFIRPFITAGDGTTSLTAIMLARRANPMRT